MGRIVLVTGGSRSGKSGYALQMAQEQTGKRLFVATCPVLDEEMRLRVERHRRERAGNHWETREEPLNLAQVFNKSSQHDVILVDCLTLWINNLMFATQQQGREMTEDDVAIQARECLHAAKAHPGTVIFVTNEVGWGIVPDNALARRFRDLAGRCNQIMGQEADHVVLLCCGLPVKLKGT